MNRKFLMEEVYQQHLVEKSRDNVREHEDKRVEELLGLSVDQMQVLFGCFRCPVLLFRLVKGSLHE